ncbi:response regulator transcription factor [Stenotrophomonas lactitubi]|uniref:response regulator transcription factor n=1 Tax=Stenotrophomonas TaxID=40323 RepID=UPI001E1AEC54|nr:response regulator transcription factor [Stenotrophomonas lactitubi]CAH0285398.1 Transcriptional regulatory protein RcsB [Stenotrophomonas lactitubi]CAH0286449.1 Transcriptional regulatory protein RcsB [Stenotrophomonas lactitubi]CAH0288407.1 Transcriptional regulatory protein RcsB [Stenotrophomonas lactitubi]CAH0291315.1 Transcriptional regulatory protein RcsB [Stenotrophomonas lactitubi]
MKTKIVIADDHPIVLAGIADVIDRDPRFTVVGQAQNPAGLVELVQAHRPKIIITDYSMPAEDSLGDGMKLISYLSRSFPQARVLVLTMVSSPSIVAEMYRAGASGVVRKSGDLKELTIALTSLLAQRVYRSPELPREEPIPEAGEAPSAALLSPREFEVIRMFASGQNVGEIARTLNRSGKTVSTQKSSAMRKLGARTDQELVAFCLESGLFG